MPDRHYATTIRGMDFAIEIWSVPSSSLANRAPEDFAGFEMREIVGADEAALSHLRHLVSLCIGRPLSGGSQGAQTNSADVEEVLDLSKASVYDGLGPTEQELVDHAVSTPLVVAESSWGQVVSLSSVLAGAGGGLFVGGPPGAVIGALVSAVGTFFVSAAKTAGEEAGPIVGRAVGNRVVGAETENERQYRARLDEIARMEEAGEITKKDAKDMRKMTFDRVLLPPSSTAAAVPLDK